MEVEATSGDIHQPLGRDADHLAQEIGVRGLLTRSRRFIISSVIVRSPIRFAFANPTFTEDRAMTTASPAACQRVNPRRQPPTLPASYTTSGDTTKKQSELRFGLI